MVSSSATSVERKSHLAALRLEESWLERGSHAAETELTKRSLELDEAGGDLFVCGPAPRTHTSDVRRNELFV
jgi:hypothetical protein